MVIAGETLGRVLISCVQALVIILGSALLFGVNWGAPAGVAAVVVLFALVASGAGIFVGTLFRNEQQAIVVDPIKEHDRGHVRIAGEDWPALSRDGLPVESGAVVRVAEINKATLLVDRVQITPDHSAEGSAPGSSAGLS